VQIHDTLIPSKDFYKFGDIEKTKAT